MHFHQVKYISNKTYIFFFWQVVLSGPFAPCCEVHLGSWDIQRQLCSLVSLRRRRSIHRVFHPVFLQTFVYVPFPLPPSSSLMMIYLGQPASPAAPCLPCPTCAVRFPSSLSPSVPGHAHSPARTYAAFSASPSTDQPAKFHFLHWQRKPRRVLAELGHVHSHLDINIQLFLHV